MNTSRRALLVNVLGVSIGILVAIGSVNLFRSYTSFTPHVLEMDTTKARLLVGASGSFVVMMDGCPACQDAKAWMVANGVDIPALSVEENPELASQTLSALESDLYPTLVIGDIVIKGFSASVYKEYLVGTNR